jgi:3-phosphoshikimate 1-carboxyvinyltransferase
MKYIVPAAKSIRGEMVVPGDKSISHRAIMFSALANGTSEIQGLSLGLDVKSTLSCLKEMAINISFERGITKVFGRGYRGLRKPATVLNAGNSGTTMRLLSGILAGQNFAATITGDDSLRHRPMNRIMDPLRQMGAQIQGSENNFAPLEIQGTVLSSFHHHLKIASAQIKSCLILAGMYAQGKTKITEPTKSRDHTERMLSYLGADVGIHDQMVSIEGFPLLQGGPIFVPGDISSAAFFIVAALIVPGSEVLIKNVGVNPTRTGIINVLQKMGADISQEDIRVQNYESFCNLFVRATELKGTTIAKELIPRVIDEIPILAVAATQAEGETIIRDASELRVKETDRIQAIVVNLRRMGAEVEELPDGMIIPGKQKLHGAEIDSFGDHRIAMAFSILGLLAEGQTVIENADCVDISFPGFFLQLEEALNG